MGNNSIVYIAPLIALTMVLALSYGSTAIGISFPKVVPSHVTLYLNDSTTVNFTFTLVNGSAGVTCIGIPDSPQLQSNGTYASVAPSSGTPNFNGTMYIATKPNAVPGNYTVQLAGGCADPTTRGIAVVYLTVLPAQKPVTTTITTTIPPTQSYNNVTNTVSASSPLILTLPNAMATVNIYTTSASPTPVKAHIANVTSFAMSIPKPQQNYTLVSAVNVSINTTANVTMLFTEHYPCSIPSSLVAPYMLKSNAWVPISNYTVNASMCTVSFYIPKDPIVGIFEKTPTTTTVSTTVPTTSIMPTTIPAPVPKPSPANAWGIVAIIAVLIILLAIYSYMMMHRKKHHGYRK